MIDVRHGRDSTSTHSIEGDHSSTESAACKKYEQEIALMKQDMESHKAAVDLMKKVKLDNSLCCSELENIRTF